MPTGRRKARDTKVDCTTMGGASVMGSDLMRWGLSSAGSVTHAGRAYWASGQETVCLHVERG